MSKNKCTKNAILSRIALLPLLLGISIFIISAQDANKSSHKSVSTSIQSTTPPPPPKFQAGRQAENFNPEPPPPPSFLKDTWWKNILMKHSIVGTGFHIDPNIYVISEKSTLDQEKKLTHFDKVLALIREKDKYFFIESPSLDISWSGSLINSPSGSISKYKLSDQKTEPYSKIDYTNLVLSIDLKDR